MRSLKSDIKSGKIKVIKCSQRYPQGSINFGQLGKNMRNFYLEQFKCFKFSSHLLNALLYSNFSNTRPESVIIVEIPYSISSNVKYYFTLYILQFQTVLLILNLLLFSLMLRAIFIFIRLI